ncbi:hypothetical protein F0562_011692 [Nyssa sinensis]|uniref:Zinc finger PHD-type domain-containing protein n=1 Tax=Nyssa sinensis TaxID=561372 RepID=A0A5J4ZRG2_9ASTE|nr:hypothetical protein F0562_011692 [Nyssa sinensis]
MEMETMIHVSHEHALVLREKEKTHETVCDVCWRLIVGSAYECEQRKCDFSIHRSCAQFPREIGHPFHPQHPLIFLVLPPDDAEKFDCSACGETGSRFIYHCSDCQFNLDVVCAALKPTEDHQDQSNQLQLQLQLLSHPHPLIICDHNEKYSPVLCSACVFPIKDLNLIYVCLECKRLLHETCTNFPEEIKHPFHPQHPLALLTRPPYESGTFGCDACRRGSSGFTYNCSQCQFDLDIHCASLMPITEDEDHQTQRHPDHEDDHEEEEEEEEVEFYCSLCGLKRDLSDPSYYCAECHYIAHVHCVVSEVVYLLEEEWYLACKLGDTKLDTPANVIKENADETVRDGSKLFPR